MNNETELLTENQEYDTPQNQIVFYSNMMENRNDNFVCFANSENLVNQQLVIPINHPIEFLDLNFQTVDGEDLNSKMITRKLKSEIERKFFEKTMKQDKKKSKQRKFLKKLVR